MLAERTNLQKKLRSLRNREINAELLLQQVQEILCHSEVQKEEVKRRLSNSEDSEITGNDFKFDLLESDRIFHLNHIKKLCIDYRLRFLSTRYFKETLPLETINAVKGLENRHDIKISGFKMVAPASYFRLENADDPILFAPIGNDYYYLIHKWGKDLHPMRKLLMWPLKNMENLIICSFVMSFFLTFGIRTLFFSKYQETAQFLLLFMYTFKSTVALIFFFGISLGKNFSSGNWNSRFYNA